MTVSSSCTINNINSRK